MSLFDFDKPSEKPIILQIPLPFSDDDKASYPWLKNDLRYYSLEEELGRGGYSVAYKGYPCDDAGKLAYGSIPIVAKLPNLRSGYSSGATDERLASMSKKSIEEWELTRLKLLPSAHANTIFDVGKAWTRRGVGGAIDELPITIQLFLSNADPLKQWLEDQHLRPEPTYDDDGREVDDWPPITSWEKWLNIVTIIAEGLVDIHQRRVIHGDIWPPNIYITRDAPSSAIFIDFGESFGVVPSGDPRLQAPHPYRAPERDRPEYVPSEQVDVYSFGKLMLYLATGTNIVIPSGSRGDLLLYGHERRMFLRDRIIERNKKLLKANPELLDLISQCTELDPVCRPSMLEILDQLRSLSHSWSRIDCSSLVDRFNGLSLSVSKLQDNSIFLPFIERKVEAVERLLSTVETEMVEITGTRDVLLAALVGLFGELSEGDSWTTLTTPSVWQANALGLDGRYATATVKAIKRGASVQRSYAISVEELGSEWTNDLIEQLRSTGTEMFLRLAEMLSQELNRFEFEKKSGLVRPGTREFLAEHRQRFRLVVESLAKMIDLAELGKRMWGAELCKIEDMTGLFIGLRPVAKLADIQSLRTKSPLSVMHLTKKTHREDQWLLVMTDVRGRNETERYEAGKSSGTGNTSSAPQLRKVRVFQSILGVPKNHILALESLMATTVNIGQSLSEFAACIAAVKSH